LDYHTAGAIYEQMGYYDSGLALATTTTNLAWKPVLFGGTAEQKQLFWDLVLNGNGYASFALTEPGGGSDVASTRTKAVRDGDEYVITGGKCFITNGGYADVYICFASTNPALGAKGISAFIVERSRPGISIGKEENKCGIRTTNTVEVVFDEVHIPADHLLGKEGDGFKLAMKTLDYCRPFISAVSTGMAQRALDEAVAYSKERVVFGKPICKNQAIQFMLADMSIKVETSRQMYCHVIDLIEQHIPNFSKEAAIAKCYCTDNTVQVALDAVQILGGYGYMRDYPVEKIMRDSKIFQIFEGTNQIQRIVISGQLLK
jgi:butyryl-CoA dehydrogenase